MTVGSIDGIGRPEGMGAKPVGWFAILGESGNPGA